MKKLLRFLDRAQVPADGQRWRLPSECRVNLTAVCPFPIKVEAVNLAGEVMLLDCLAGGVREDRRYALRSASELIVSPIDPNDAIGVGNVAVKVEEMSGKEKPDPRSIVVHVMTTQEARQMSLRGEVNAALRRFGYDPADGFPGEKKPRPADFSFSDDSQDEYGNGYMEDDSQEVLERRGPSKPPDRTEPEKGGEASASSKEEKPKPPPAGAEEAAASSE